VKSQPIPAHPLQSACLLACRCLILGAVMMLLTSNASAKSKHEGLFSVGFGKQYGGNVGIQIAPKIKNVRFNIGAGLFTAHAGVGLVFNRRIEVGVHGFMLLFTNIGSGAHLNYYFNTVNRKGFMLGVDVSRLSFTGTDTHHLPSKRITTVSVGYQF